MPRQVVILHGWSDDSGSFHDLREFLGNNDFEATEVWLGDYISMDDDVRIPDVAKRMQVVLTEKIDDRTLAPPFDLIVHSTGGLVAREWVARYYPDGSDGEGNVCPVKRIVMLSPANFGSRLAAAGKSFVGRVVRGFDNWFQTGTEMLSGLELASPYQWDLARRDLLDADGQGFGAYGGDKVWPFVITGGRGYTSRFRRVANEDGADGTVRACAANMNTAGLTIDFSGDENKPQFKLWWPRCGTAVIPFAILPDRDHSSVHHPMEETDAPDLQDRLGAFILEALNCDSPERFAEIADSWEDATEQVGELRDDERRRAVFHDNVPPGEAFHQYLQVIVAVFDDQGQPIDDYFMEFFSPRDRRDDEAVYFQKHVLQHVHVNALQKHFRCLYVDRTDLMLGYYPKVEEGAERVVAMSLSAAPLGANIRYFSSEKEGAAGHLIVHRENEGPRSRLKARLRRNMTHLVEIIVPRQPIDEVFQLTQPR